MWNFGFIVLSMGTMIVPAGFVVCDRLLGAAPHGGCRLCLWLDRFDGPPIGELSAGQTRVVSALRVAGGIGLVIIWSALLTMLIHLDGLHLAQLWQNDHQARAMIYAPLYTGFVLPLMRSRASIWGPASWNQGARIAWHAFIMLVFFANAVLAIAV